MLPRHDTNAPLANTLLTAEVVCCLLCITASSFAQTSSSAVTVHGVVIVSVDGLRADLLTRGGTPVMHDLIKDGSYALWARTVDEGYTVPSHVSMLTGVVPSRHGVTWNHHIEEAYPDVPTLFEVARHAGYRTGLAVSKTKLTVLTRPGTLDHSFIGNEDHTNAFDVARQAIGFLRSAAPPRSAVRSLR